jgi:hypothetical protein
MGAGFCSIHDNSRYPKGCKSFFCPYRVLESEGVAFPVMWGKRPSEGNDFELGEQFIFRVHRPDCFEDIMRDAAEFIPKLAAMPLIPQFIPVEEARSFIKESKAFLGARALSPAANAKECLGWITYICSLADGSSALFDPIEPLPATLPWKEFLDRQFNAMLIRDQNS